MYPSASISHLLGVEGGSKSLEGSQALIAGWKAKAPTIGRWPLSEKDKPTPALGGVSGGAMTSWMAEQWRELHAWCGFLAGNLEGSCQRIETLGAERRQLDGKMSELRSRISYLEHLCSQRNVQTLEQQIEALQEQIDGFDSVRAELESTQQRLVHAEEQQQRLTTARLACDASTVAMAKQRDAAEGEAAHMAAELEAERTRRLAAEQLAEQREVELVAARQESAEAHAACRKAEARTEETKANSARAIGDLRASHAAELKLAAESHDATKALLVQCQQQLRVEIEARAAAEKRCAHAKQSAERAMRSCKQWEDKASSATAALAAAEALARSRPAVPGAFTPPAPAEPAPPKTRPAPKRPDTAPPSSGLSKMSLSSAQRVAGMVMGSRPSSPTSRPAANAASHATGESAADPRQDEALFATEYGASPSASALAADD